MTLTNSTSISNNFNIKNQNMVTFTNTTSDVQKNAEKSSLTLENQVLELARKAVGNSMKLQEKGEVRVELKGDQYIVIFVHKLSPGVLGADYDAKVWLNAKTGRVEKVLVGS